MKTFLDTLSKIALFISASSIVLMTAIISYQVIAFANLIVAGAGLVMVIAGWQLTTTLWAFDIPSLGLPRGIALLPLPIAGALIMLFSLAQLFEDQSDDQLPELKSAATPAKTKEVK